MTAVPDTERRTRYAPVTATPEFLVGFTIFDDDDVAVFHDGVEIERNDETDGWTISASYDQFGESAAAKVVTEGAGWFGVTVDIVGRRRPARADQFADGRGVPAKDQNLILNRVMANLREVYDRGQRGVVGAFGETINQLPAAATRASTIFAFDEDGQPEMRTDLIGDAGDDGWSPEFAIASDGARRVLQLIGYVGGTGTEPTDHVGKYVGATAMEALIANGVDIRGAPGSSGAGTGDLLAANNLDDLDDIPTALTNLGLGELAVLDTADLGDLAFEDEVAFADVAAAALANEAQTIAGTANLLVQAAHVPAAVASIGGALFEPLGGAGLDAPFDKIIIARKTSNQGTTSQTLANLTELSFAIGAGETWLFEADIHGTRTASGASLILSVNGPASPASFSATITSVGDGVTRSGVITSYDGTTNQGNLGGDQNGQYSRISGLIVNGANAGTVQLRLAKSGTGTTATVYANSLLKAYRIA